MSILFRKQGRKIIRIIFIFLAVLVTLSMIAFSAPGLFGLF